MVGRPIDQHAAEHRRQPTAQRHSDRIDRDRDPQPARRKSIGDRRIGTGRQRPPPPPPPRPAPPKPRREKDRANTAHHTTPHTPTIPRCLLPLKKRTHSTITSHI